MEPTDVNVYVSVNVEIIVKAKVHVPPTNFALCVIFIGLVAGGGAGGFANTFLVIAFDPLVPLIVKVIVPVFTSENAKVSVPTCATTLFRAYRVVTPAH